MLPNIYIHFHISIYLSHVFNTLSIDQNRHYHLDKWSYPCLSTFLYPKRRILYFHLFAYKYLHYEVENMVLASFGSLASFEKFFFLLHFTTLYLVLGHFIKLINWLNWSKRKDFQCQNQLIESYFINRPIFY